MKKIKGFTMIELILTMMIVIILSLISWPIYRSSHSREFSMLAEGYALLGTIKDAQIHYYNEFGNFLSAKSSFAKNYSNAAAANLYTAIDPVLGINVMNNKYFTWFKYEFGDSALGYWRDRFKVFIYGNLENNNIVTMVYPFNLTERGELTIIGNGTTTINGNFH